MKRVIGAAVAAATLIWASAAGAASVITYDDGVAGQTEGPWTLVDDGNGGLAASLTEKHPVYGYFVLHWDSIRTPGGEFRPTFGVELDTDYSDKFTDDVLLLDIIFPQGGYIKSWGNTQYFAPGERITTGAQGIYFVHADEVWIDNVQYEQTNVAAYVPEPATWAMMIVGFGLTGGAIRQRRSAAAT